jgi:hypothetical protein
MLDKCLTDLDAEIDCLAQVGGAGAECQDTLLQRSLLLPHFQLWEPLMGPGPLL